MRALHDPAFFYKASPSHIATWLTMRHAPDTPQSPDPPQDRVLLLLQAGAGPEISPHPLLPREDSSMSLMPTTTHRLARAFLPEPPGAQHGPQSTVPCRSHLFTHL